MEVTGLAGAGAPEAAARAAVQLSLPGIGIDWRAESFKGPYCYLLDVLRGIRTGTAGDSDALALSRGGRRGPLQDGDKLAPVLVSPSYPAVVYLFYLSSDGAVAHLYPTLSAQPGVIPPGTDVELFRPQAGGVAEVGRPFGLDMLVAVASSVPLPGLRRSDNDRMDGFLADLNRAAVAARKTGAVLSVRVLPVQTVPKPPRR